MKYSIHPILTIAAMLLFSSCGKKAAAPDLGESTPDSEFMRLSSAALDNASLSMTKAGASEVGERAQAFGEITLNTDRVESIPARIDGIIATDHVQLGDAIETGQVLAVLESQSLASAIVAYLESERDLRFSRSEFGREEELFAKKLTSAESFNSKQQALHKAQIAHAAALQPLELINFDEAELHRYVDEPESANLTRLEVKSPISGVLTKKQVIRGGSVTADQELFVIANLEEVWVDFQVPLSDAQSLQKGQLVRVGSSTGDARGEAAIRYVAPMANELSRTVTARATLANEAGIWRPGTPVIVSFDRNRESFPVTVPAASVLDFEGTSIVFVQRSSGVFELREVEPGRRDETRVSIKSGLVAGEDVVADGAYQLKAQWGMNTEG